MFMNRRERMCEVCRGGGRLTVLKRVEDDNESGRTAVFLSVGNERKIGVLELTKGPRVGCTFKVWTLADTTKKERNMGF
jgi:hypothetical protein